MLKGKNAKYFIFICLGVIILIAVSASQNSSSSSNYDTYNEKRLVRILNQIEGLSSAEVMITSKNSEAEGAIIVAQGAENLEIKNQIYSAVSAALGIGQHKIEVFAKKKCGEK